MAWNFNPRSPCGERPEQVVVDEFQGRISIHALLAESDRTTSRPSILASGFQSTLSLRRATLPSRESSWTERISIHALLAESDYTAKTDNYNTIQFQSTLSLRRATWTASSTEATSRFQSTLSLRRATDDSTVGLGSGGDFNPRSPCGERRSEAASGIVERVISIHALLAESDPCSGADGPHTV